ncbi:MAG TPA: DUF554 domain-containing protein [Thermotoga sp.]|nr:DUF554 domain-containing protein [Thermotoga sp.]
MLHYAVIVNTIAVILGGTFGTVFGKGISEKYKTILFHAVGLTTLAIGVRMVMEGKEFLLILGSMALGGIIGTFLGIEEKLQRLANYMNKKRKDEANFAKGFVTASVLFLAGPMTIIGSINIGVSGDPNLILIKSLLDGISSTILSSLFGIGVAFSAIMVFLVQGLLVSFSSVLKFLATPEFIGDFVGVGGIMILALGIRILEIKDIKVGDFLPALFIIPFFDWLKMIF